MAQWSGLNTDFREAGAPIALASNTDSNSDRIDMQGYEGCVFICAVTDSVSTGVATLKIEGNTVDSDSGMTAISGAAATATCAVNDDINDKLLIASVHRPTSRYVQAVRTSATANIAFGSVIALPYGKRVQPYASDASVLNAAHAIGG